MIDSLNLEYIDDEVLASFDVPKLQRVVLLKWKDQVLADGAQMPQRGFPSRSADRYGRSNSAYRRRAPPNEVASHLYPPNSARSTRSVDSHRRRQLSSRSQGRRSGSARRGTPRKPKDPFIELFSRFDSEGNGYVEQAKLHVLMFSTLLVHRQKQLEENPSLDLPTKEEIRPKVNSLLWDVLKQVDFSKSGYISLDEYLTASGILLVEWKKSLSQGDQQNTYDAESDDDSDDENEMQRTKSHLDQQQERAIGQELMIQTVKLCKVWNEKQGTTRLLIQYLKQTLEQSEKKLKDLHQTSI